MKNKHLGRAAVFVLAAVVMASGAFAFGSGDTGSSAGGHAAYAGNYAFGGSTTVEPIVVAAIESLKDMYPDAKISYDSTGSSVGIKGALSGTYRLGGASRALKQSEKDAGAVAHAIAYDGVAVVVNKNTVPFENISQLNLTKIYTGEITNWKQLGGPDADIVVINRDEASGTRSCFKDATVKKAKKDFVNTAVIVTGNGDMVSKVGTTPYAIGYCGFGYITRHSGTKPLSVDGVKPVAANVLDGSYSVSRSLILVSKGNLKHGSLEEAFIAYLLSDEGQAIVKEEKFIPLTK